MIAFEKSSIKCPNWASSGFMKIRHVKKIKPTKLYDGERRNKNNFWCTFDPDTRVCNLNNRAQDTLLQQLFLSRVYLIDSIFAGVLWINKLHDFMKGFVSLTTIAMEIGERQVLQLS